MAYVLPTVKTGKKLHHSWFPSEWQAVIFRCWTLIEPEVIASVLETDTETVISAALDMGLPGEGKADPDWLTKGYITIIRAVWHLLSYEQIEKLLGWTEDKLAFIIREDDFLWVKLGMFKPDSGKTVWQPLTYAQKLQTEAVRRSVEQGLAEMPEVTAKPFSFTDHFASFEIDGKGKQGKKKIIYSYCSLYGDTFSDDRLLDESYPDSLLKAYADCGITGVWTQAVLHTLVKSPFDPSLSEGCERRLEGVRKLTEKLKKYGLKLYLYLNEPRAMPNEFFEGKDDLKGYLEGNYSALCTSSPKVKKWLSDATEAVMRGAPDIGGFLTITASENLTNCFSHTWGTNCPHCKSRCPSDVFAEVNTLLYEGAAKVRPDIDFIAWNWGWEDRDVEPTIRKMPSGITVMSVSEYAVKKDIGGVQTSVVDYSISIVGPGEQALRCWNIGRETGHKTFAKVQANITWECAAMPFVPAFDLVYKHLKGIKEQGNVDGMMLGWTLGGYPSPTFRMLKEMFADEDNIPSLHEIFGRIFPAQAADIIERASAEFSKGYYEYPFSIGVAYNAPQLYGPTIPLYPEDTGFISTMVGYPYDDFKNWREIFPEDVYISQMKKLCAGWEKGLAILDTLPEDLKRNNPDIRLLCQSAEGHYCHFRSCYELAEAVVARREGRPLTPFADSQRELVLRLAAVQACNPMVGYEASNHYFYTRNTILEKLVNIDYIRRIEK